MANVNHVSVSADASARLDGQQQRREQGVPTVTTFVAEGDAGFLAWKAWLGHHGSTSIHWTGESIERVAQKWIDCVLERNDLFHSSLSLMARREDGSQHAFRTLLASKSQSELARFLRHRQEEIGGMAPRIASWSIAQIMARQAPKASDLLLGCRTKEEDSTTSTLTVVAGVANLAGGSLPGVWIDAMKAGSNGPPDPFADAAVAWAEGAPAVPIAMGFPPTPWREFLSGAESRAKAILRSGMIDLTRGLSASSQKETDESQATLEDQSRSAAERLLFQKLEELPQTRGCFQLNQSHLCSTVGERLEIDLLSTSFHVAIEIDGYYHFQDPEAYRRDRRKDLVMQQEGLLVLRFLAEDVMTRTADVVATILRATDEPQRTDFS